MATIDPILADLLEIDRVTTDLQVNSKKRLLEETARIFCTGQTALDRDTVFQILFERERLGSTGIGNQVALPHGRISGLETPLGMLATLRNPLDYDAIDQQPVSLVFGLLVPAEANEKHLHILASLAGLFSNESVVANLVQSRDKSQLLESFLNADTKPNRQAI